VDLRGLLGRHVVQARQVVQLLLDGRLICTPFDNVRGRGQNRTAWEAPDERYRRPNSTYSYRDRHENDLSVFIEELHSQTQDAQPFVARTKLRARGFVNLVTPYTERDVRS